MSFRFVHTADLHLDSPLRSLALRDEGLAQRVGVASREVLVRIVDLCLAEAVDALLIAGDLYDGSQTSMKTAGFLTVQLRRLDDAGIRVFLIRGNHDAESRLTPHLMLPPNVHVFGSGAAAGVERIETPGRPVAIHGISFARGHETENLLPRFAAPLPGAINIGMLHTSLDGAAGHDPYAPCPVSALQASGFDYWALGHIHLRREHAGRTHIVMPGIPQGRDIGEAGAKSVSLVAIAADGRTTVEARDLSLLRFARIAVPVDGVADWPAMVAALHAALQAARQAMPGDLVLRPRLSGMTPLAWRLTRDRDILMAEAQAAAALQGAMWIDGLDLGATEPAERSATGALADLETLLAGLDRSDAALDAMIDDAARGVRAALPPDLRDLLGRDPDDMVSRQTAFLRDGVDLVLAHLRSAGSA